MSITTERLVLRPLALSDAARIALLAGDFDVASMTGTIPHPYNERMAGEWIGSALEGEEGTVFVIERDGSLIGCVGYREDGCGGAELGYWLGKPYWGHGYASEASAAMVAYAFDEGGLDYLTIGHFADNPASARIIAKLGFRPQGEIKRDCVARDATARCLTYRLERASGRG
jgi:RimJ/RimL family protein N-acetyltransferase